MSRPKFVHLGLIAVLALLVSACLATVEEDADDASPPEPEVTPTATPMPEQDPTPSPEIEESIAHGGEIYSIECEACHGPEGEGAESAGFGIPNLNENSLVVADNPGGAISTLLTGRGGMPRFSGMSDDDIAAVVSYIRTAWDNDAAPADADAVTEMRDTIYGADD